MIVYSIYAAQNTIPIILAEPNLSLYQDDYKLKKN